MDQSQPPSEAELVEAAFAHYQAGRIAEAATAFRSALALNPDRIGALLMLGMILSDGPESDPAAAEALFNRCLELSPENFLALNHLGQLYQGRDENVAAVALFGRAVAQNPGFAPALNNMGVSLHRLGRRTAALAALDRALTLDANLIAVHGNRGHVLADLGRWDEARAAFQQAVACTPDAAAMWRNLGTASHHVNLLADAEACCRRAIELDPDDLEAIIQLATTLERAGRNEEAQLTFAEAAQRRGLIVDPCLDGEPAARVLILCAQGGSNVPPKYLFDHKLFETIAISLPPPGTAGFDMDAVIAGLPPFDIVFSAVGDGDADDPFLRQTDTLARRLGRPLLNPPERIPPTCRDALPGLLAGIPGVIAPATRQVARADLEGLAATGTIERPVLVRPLGSHGGHDLCRIESAAALDAYLREAPQDTFYVTDFVDYASGDGYYRKYRFIFVDRQPFSYHLAIHTDWLIHYFRADMNQAPWMKREEEAFLADYRAVFPGALADAVGEVARRLDLDYGGMDCGITPDGRVLVFEANACMLLHLLDSPEDFPYKHTYVPRIVDAIGRMTLARLK
jgi:Tfp pilus assembly protein PilF